MDISVDLYYNDENIGGKIDVLRIRKSLRDRSNPLELPNAKFFTARMLNVYCLRAVEVYLYTNQPNLYNPKKVEVRSYFNRNFF
ncbi:PREDICTED: uncharacterized protein LOC108975761 isoform X2 [Bactrocera latifrons]|uniref:uncharacterized protein LOC108975761 isoform X2 n=1 Tax=Bactrocera latifrons TaxID=174628 RepID=UPI0008DDEA8F|nr:PREDICTED: uncharacterized protein LOC108975761 isoform X2 [Bactrocera latifrons]